MSAKGPRLLWIGSGLAVGVVAGLLVASWQASDDLTPERLSRARERWRHSGPESYTLEIEVRGSTNARHLIEVRDGDVVGMMTGGSPAAESAWPYWSVDGLFESLETELRNAEDPTRAFGAAAGRVVMRAQFDPETGYPMHFLRHVLGSQRSIEWEVLGLRESG